MNELNLGEMSFTYDDNMDIIELIADDGDWSEVYEDSDIMKMILRTFLDLSDIAYQQN